jgi:adenylate cyclase
VGDVANTRRAAELALERAEAILAKDQYNASVLAYSAFSLAALHESERSKARMERALLIDPDNVDMRYNFACALTAYLHDKDGALEMLAPLLAEITAYLLRYLKTDPDFDSLHDDPRWQAMVAAAEARLAVAKQPVATETRQPA